MNELVAEGTGLPLPYEEAYARAQEFRRLSLEKRWECILNVIAMGMEAIETSPQRELIDQWQLESEAEWQRIQKELFSSFTPPVEG